MMPNTEPLVGAAVICERVLQETEGVNSLIRLVDRFTLTEVTLPVPQGVGVEGKPVQLIDLTAFVMLKSGDIVGKSEAVIVMRHPVVDGKAPKTAKLPIKWELDLKGGEHGASLVAQFSMPVSASEGLYWFDVIWEGKKLTSIPLRLVRAPKSQEHDQSATS